MATDGVDESSVANIPNSTDDPSDVVDICSDANGCQNIDNSFNEDGLSITEKGKLKWKDSEI